LLKKQLTVMVSALRQLTPRVREYVLADVGGHPLPHFEAGSHIALYLSTPEGPLLRHYSLVSKPDGKGADDRKYTIAVQRENGARGSAYIHDHFKPGTQLRISHPKSQFALDRRDTQSLLIAGGIGITPILSMAHSLAKRGRDFQLLYIGKQANDMAYLAEVTKLGAARASLYTTRQGHGLRPDLAALLASQAPGTSVYVCGPPSLVDTLKVAAAALGWAPQRVHHEWFSTAVTGHEVAFTLELRQSGRTLNVGPRTSILDAMTAAGMHPLFDCRRGECGLCPLPVLESDGPLTHHDRFLTAQEKAMGKTLCICVSRTQGSRLVLAA
jgi:vanillate O-demethylase ferredoxin subunit